MPDPNPRPFDRRTPATVVGLLLLVGMAVLLLHGPSFVANEGEDDEVAVSCGSILTVGWPSDHSSLDTEGARSYGDHVRRGETDFVARDGIARDCSERRDTYLAFLMLLAVPAAVCLSYAVAAHRPTPAQPAA